MIRLWLCFMILWLSAGCHRNGLPFQQTKNEKGVSESLAQYRAMVVSNLSYKLQFTIPEKKEEAIKASELISFHWKKNRFPLSLDFKESRDHIQSIQVNGKEIPVVLQQEHLIIAAANLVSGHNEVAIGFTAGELSLNRNQDYLYTLLVPDRARTLFPCFDQPDLKASFQLTLTIPKSWKAVSNGPLRDSSTTGGATTCHFQQSDLISTYLFSFVAGKFDLVSRNRNGRWMNFYHRETDSNKIKQSIEPIFQLHQQALDFLEAYTGIPYPFKKFDFVAIPDFQYGGMEHVGAIQYRAQHLFLDDGATQDQKIARSNLIAHESAHTWFGNLVTMRWFNDVWMKEVFANLMADKITERTLPDANADLKFFVEHFPDAFAIDRTAGANPIRQPLANLQDAGSLYGSIIYDKAPIVMRQLEQLIGEENFKKGLRDYLKKHAHGNASWPELIEVLDAHTNIDLKTWNKVWVNKPGRPVFDYTIEASNGKISRLALQQRAENGSSGLGPQVFKIALVYADRVEEVSVSMERKTEVVEEAKGKAIPGYLLFNSSGLGYGLFPVDTLMLSGPLLKDPMMRASAYLNSYENMLSGRYISPAQIISLYKNKLTEEKEELNLRLLTAQLTDVFWRLTKPADRKFLAASLEKEVWQAMQAAGTANNKKILFKTYQSIALSKDALEQLYTIWQQQKAPVGVKLTEDDYTSLAVSLTIKEYPAEKIIEQQIVRVQNPDRKKRLEFLLPALSNDVHQRDAFFYSLKEEKNREKESWVLSALAYLHHPLRAATSEKYIRPSLELLEEIQRTGDIFFPQSWLQETLGYYQTFEAAAVVRSFLDAHSHYNPQLKAKILQAADNLFRAEKLLDR